MQVLYKNTWGFLSGNVTDSVAAVVCRQLGFSDGILAPSRTFAAPGSASLYWQVAVSCGGGESDLVDCIQAAAATTNGTAVGVYCDWRPGTLHLWALNHGCIAWLTINFAASGLCLGASCYSSSTHTYAPKCQTAYVTAT